MTSNLTVKAVASLKNGKLRLESAGWVRGSTNGDTVVRIGPYGEVLNVGATGECLATCVHSETYSTRYIKRALGLRQSAHDSEIWEYNDRQPPTNEGRLWAIGILSKAIELAEADLARQEGSRE